MSNLTETPVRSPSYPTWALADALAAVRKIEAQYRRSKVDREVAAKVIGYSVLSGPANKALAALAQFGLVERAGKGEMRVTERAIAILHPDNEAEKRRELHNAAFEPQLFREFQERWPGMVPPEDGVVSYLNRKGFNQTAIRPASKAYLQTLLFLEQESVTSNHEMGQTVGTDRSPLAKLDGQVEYGGANVGDWINYESDGSVANPKPMRVRAVSDDGAWVFVDDSDTGLEMSQVILTDAPDDFIQANRPTLPLNSKANAADKPSHGMRKALFPLEDGDVTLLFPENLSLEGLADLGDYLDIFLKKERKKRE